MVSTTNILLQVFTGPSLQSTLTLPIELLSFETKRTNSQEVLITWSTASEKNNKGFEVQRLLEGETTFKTVAFVDGQGNSTTVQAYNKTDANTFTGTSYYRLKQLDIDGKFQYSKTVAVEGKVFSSATNLTVFPNPTKGALNFQLLEPLEDEQVFVTLTNVQGQKVKELTINIDNNQVVQLPHLLDDLSSNLYLLQVRTLDGKKQWNTKVSLQ